MLKNNAQENEARYLQLLNVINNLPGCVYWKNRQGHYLGCNQVFLNMVGLEDEDQVIGKTDDELPWKKDAVELRKHDQYVMHSRAPQALEEMVSLATRKRRVYSVVKAPLTDSYGRIIGIVGTSIDITERHESERLTKDALRRADLADQKKTEFIQNMSHDLRTPLAGILGAAEFIAASTQESITKEMATDIVSASNALLGLINEILDYAKLLSSEQPISVERKFSLGLLLGCILELFKPTTIEKNIELSLDIVSAMPTVLIGDTFRLKHILINLLSNAVKFTHEGRVILKAGIGAENNRQVTLRFLIEDTGIGMSAEKVDDIYESFVRLLPSHKGKYQGTGLGLTITKRLVTEMGGEIDVNSQEGVGTIFSCVIPFKKPLLDLPMEEHMPMPFSAD